MSALAMQYHITAGSADLVGGRSLATDEWLRVVVFTALFTDARAAENEIPAGFAAGETARGGYWGDSFHRRSLGSLLWTLRREKVTNEVVLRARDICRQALAWLLEEGHLRRIDVETERLAANRLGILVTATRNDGVTTRITQEFMTDGI